MSDFRDLNVADADPASDANHEEANAQFSKEIVTEEFYVPGADLEQTEFEVESKDTFADDLRRATETFQKEREQQNEISESPESVADEEPSKKEPEHLESDFFDQPVPDDDEKKKVVDQIAGMAEISEDTTESQEDIQSQVSQGSRPSVAFQFKGEDVVPKPQEEDAAGPVILELETPELVLPELIEAPTTRRRVTASSLGRSSVGSRSGPRKTLEEADIRYITRAGSRSASRKSSASDVRSSVLVRSDTDTADLYIERPSIKTPRGSYAITRRKETMSYGELAPRIRMVAEEDDDFMGFDMADGDIPFLFGDITEVEEEAPPEEEEEAPALDREPYYERHDQAAEEVAKRKIQNFVLQKMLVMYFKRKKMDYVTKETDWSFDQQTKYNRKLVAYGELMEFDARERARLNQEVSDTKQQRSNKFDALTADFKKMQSRENEIGHGLIHSKTGNVIPDKAVERLVHRQSTQMAQVSSMRLTFIRLKQMVQEKLDSIADLDEIAPGFRLADFEQLKQMNQSHADKLEEKDELLNRLRARCSNTIQTLAHLREKSAALDNDLADLMCEHEDVGNTFIYYRGTLNNIKQERDNYRRSTDKLKNESGLLTQPKLLVDMEQGLTDVKVSSAHLELVIREYKKRAKQIKIIRMKIEETKEQRRLMRKSSSRLRGTSLFRLEARRGESTIYKGRPCLMIPKIEESAFNKLTTIKPKITYDKSRFHSGIKHSKRTDG